MYLSRLLLAIYLFGLVGVAAELVLLEHYDGTLQLIPFGAIALALGFGGWYARRPGVASLRAFRALQVVFAATGTLGLVLHFRGNMEFERERDPAIGGFSLIWESLTGATPALAPGTMVLFALIGYAVLVSREKPSP